MKEQNLETDINLSRKAVQVHGLVVAMCRMAMEATDDSIDREEREDACYAVLALNDTLPNISRELIESVDIADSAATRDVVTLPTSS